MKYDLMFACLGNGTTVCDRAQIEHGDYKIIAHISDGGNVKYYDDKKKMPDYAIESIENLAALERKSFREEFLKKSKIRQYEIILESIPMNYKPPKDAYNTGWRELLDYYFSIA